MLRLSVETPVKGTSAPLVRAPSAAAASARRIMPCSAQARRAPALRRSAAPAGDLLVGLVPFPRDENDVSRVGAGQRDLDGAGAVRFHLVRRGDAALDVGDDRERILAARIVGGDDHAVGEAASQPRP